jgi:hypothetical protein
MLVPLAAGFEIANVASRLPALDGRRAEALEPYRLGALETAWRSLEHAGTPAEMRTALAASSWGDPGGDTPWALVTGMRMAAVRRTAVAVQPARRWAQGRAVLLAAGRGGRPGRVVPGRRSTPRRAVPPGQAAAV